MNVLMLLWRYKTLIIVALLLASTWFYKSRYEATVNEYDAFKTEQSTLVRIANEKNAIIEANAKRSLVAEIEKHKALTESLKLDRAKLAKELQHEITLNGNRINAYANRLQIDSTNRNAMPEVTTDPCGFAKSERECNRTYIATLENAGASCAVDFNLARSWIDTVCANYGC